MSNFFSPFTQIRNLFIEHIENSRRESINVEKSWVISLLLFSALLFCIAAIGFVTQGYHWGFAEINARSTFFHPALLHLITSFGDGIFLVALLLYFAHKKAPLLLTAILATIIGGLVSNSLKRYFNADRPPAVLELEAFNLIGKAYRSRSFPSGHTLTAFLVATVFSFFVQNRIFKLAFMLAAVFAGLSRVWLGVHWFIDILVGGALGILCGLAAVFSARSLIQKTPTYVICAVLILFCITAIVALVEPSDYYYAQWLISLTAILALWRVCSTYVIPAFNASLIKNFNREDITVRLFFLCIFLITGYRIFVILQPHLNLFYDEAYYYHWSLDPSLGYYSKPPVVAWSIWLTTQLVGHTVLGVKLAAPLFYAAASYFVYLIGCRLSGVRAGVFAALIFFSAPIIGFNSSFITTDAPLLFFWSASLYFFILATDTNKLAYWIALGIATGLGMLSKYSMAALPLAFLLFSLSSAKHRGLISKPQAWLAASLTLAIFSLNLFWNSQNGWISFLHTSEISKQSSSTLNPIALIEFLLAQIFVFGPVWCIFLLYRCFKQKNVTPALNRTCQPDKQKLLWFATLTILVIISLQALSSRAFPNWAAPWIVGASVLLGIYIASAKQYRIMKVGLLSHLLLASMFYHWPHILNHLNIEPTKRNTPYQRIAGWKEVSNEIEPIMRRFPKAILASDSRDLLAYIGFYANPGQNQFARWNPDKKNIRDHYDLKHNMRIFEEGDTEFVFISKQNVSEALRSSFREAYMIKRIDQHALPDVRRTVYIYKLRGFKGYD